MKEKHLTIVITEKCNLKCTYCYERNRTLRKPNLYKIKQFIIEEINNPKNKDFDIFFIEFFGGEPFIEFKLIKEITKFIRTLKTNKRIHLFAITNGTLVHGSVKEWLINNKDIFSCGLSFDGDEYSQNINRSNSFKLIDLDFFIKNYPGQWVKMTISEESLKYLAHNVIYCHSHGALVHANLAYGIDWSNREKQKILNDQLDELIKFYLENPTIEPCSLLDGALFLGPKNPTTVHRWCGVTSNSMVVYSIDGKKYPCQLLLPLSSKDRTPKLQKIPELIEINKYDKKCHECELINLCPTCFCSNLVNNGNPFMKDEGFCEMQKIMIRKKAIFNAKKWEKGLLDKKLEEEKLFLTNIKRIIDATDDYEFDSK